MKKIMNQKMWIVLNFSENGFMIHRNSEIGHRGSDCYMLVCQLIKCTDMDQGETFDKAIPELG